MAKCIWSYLQAEKRMAANVRDVYGAHALKKFNFLEILDTGPSITEIRVALEIEAEERHVSKEATFRLILNDSADKRPVMRHMPDTTWGVVNWGYGAL